MANAQITMVVEGDEALGDGFQHVFPTHQDHKASALCRCGPQLLLHGETEDGQKITVYWHPWK